MKMRTVNPYLVAAILEPFLFLDVDEAASAASISPDDEAGVRSFMRRVLVPYFSMFDERSKLEIRDSLGYMLLQGSERWEHLLSMNQCPMALPSPPSKFFEWLWDEIFHQDVCLSENLAEYVVKEDIHAPNLIKRG
jgi:hypothetical protein